MLEELGAMSCRSFCEMTTSLACFTHTPLCLWPDESFRPK
jgi:hypothetical protein